MAQFEHQYLKTNGVWLHVAAAGPQDGPLMIFLHGFPEFWYAWSRHMDYFAEQGYRVLAVDQRGYNLSDRPPRVGDYRSETLAADVAGLVRAAGREKAVIVGHDWGGLVAWYTAILHPEVVERLVVMNAPHPEAFARYLPAHPGQWLRSWYALYFQIPRLPEAQFRPFGWLAVRMALRSSSRPGTFSQASMRAYRLAWSRPGAMTAMLNWYRAALRFPRLPMKNPFIQVPTLIIWGARDRFLSADLASESLNYCAHGRLVLYRQATHWVQHEERPQVNALIHAFMTPEG